MVELKEDLPKIYAWRFLDKHKEFGADELEELTGLFRKYGEEIEAKFKTSDKRIDRLDEDTYSGISLERVCEIQGNIPSPTIRRLESKIDDPEKIGNL